jgi:hypothetical protein
MKRYLIERDIAGVGHESDRGPQRHRSDDGDPK